MVELSAKPELSKVFEEFHADRNVCCQWEALRLGQSVLLNHWDIICDWLLRFANSGSFIYCRDVDNNVSVYLATRCQDVSTEPHWRLKQSHCLFNQARGCISIPIPASLFLYTATHHFSVPLKCTLSMLHCVFWQLCCTVITKSVTVSKFWLD